MAEEKPLHIQVAEALGWLDCTQPNPMNRYSWVGWRPHSELGWREPVPNYMLDWSATGPVMERLGIRLTCIKYEDGARWSAYWQNETEKCPTCGHEDRSDISWPPEVMDSWCVSALEAVCRLILHLTELGFVLS